MTIRPELLDELLKDYQTPQDLFGENGMIKQLTKGMIEALPASPRCKSTSATPSMDAQKSESPNTRNGSGQKTRQSEHGELEISVPRDRDGRFEPLLVKKRQSRLEGFLREDSGAVCPWDDHQGYPGPAPRIVWRRGFADIYLGR